MNYIEFEKEMRINKKFNVIFQMVRPFFLDVMELVINRNHKEIMKVLFYQSSEDHFVDTYQIRNFDFNLLHTKLKHERKDIRECLDRYHSLYEVFFGVRV